MEVVDRPMVEKMFPSGVVLTRDTQDLVDLLDMLYQMIPAIERASVPIRAHALGQMFHDHMPDCNVLLGADTALVKRSVVGAF